MDERQVSGRIALMDVEFNYRGKDVRFMNLDPDDHIESYLARGVFYEERVLKFIEDLKVEGNYLDAGAYNGNHSVFFSLFCPSGTVYAFEPQADAYRKMISNLVKNRTMNVLPWNCGLGDKLEMGAFVNTVLGNKGMAERTYKSGCPEESTVQIFPLDAMNFEVKLMKVDVEGMELNVLRGAEKTLEGVEHLFVEVPPRYDPIDEMRKFCSERGFHIESIFSEEQLFYFRKVR
jgi:protein O-GlcNAc transferase